MRSCRSSQGLISPRAPSSKSASALSVNWRDSGSSARPVSCDAAGSRNRVALRLAPVGALEPEIAQLDAPERPAGDQRLQLPRDGLDLGQLGHSALILIWR